jgi:hypothetical protein
MAQRESTARPPRKKASRFQHYNHPALSESVIFYAANSLGRGFDVTNDFRLGSVKGRLGSFLVELDKEDTQDLITPSGLKIANVSKQIRLEKGERTRYQSDVLSFNEVSTKVLLSSMRWLQCAACFVVEEQLVYLLMLVAI